MEPELLEASLRSWKRKGWRTLDFRELDPILNDRESPPSRGLVLTADDGYVDNWLALEPLLRRYGFSATVFISTDFIDPRPICRRQWHPGAPIEDVEWKGYLSWPEMRAMESTGTVTFGSHARTHTWHFVSERVIDFYRPEVAATRAESVYRFLWLNAFPERKPFLFAELSDDAIPWGTPIYEFRPALVARRFFPAERETEICVEHVARKGGTEFFDRPDWRTELNAELERFRAGARTTGAYETLEDMTARVRSELRTSRRVLSEGLGRSIDVLSCPQGAMSPLVEALAEEEGYRIWTASSWKVRGLNWPGRPSRRVFRCGRGYELFGNGASIDMRVASQNIVLQRYSGRPLARVLTAALTLANRVRRRKNANA